MWLFAVAFRPVVGMLVVLRRVLGRGTGDLPLMKRSELTQRSGDAGPRCFDFWWPGETGAATWWQAVRRKASGWPAPAKVGLMLGASRGRKFRHGPDARPAG